MTLKAVRLLGVTLALLLAAASRAPATLVNWQYNATPGANDVYSDAGLGDSGTYVHFSNENEVPRQTSIGGFASNITASNLSTFATTGYPGQTFTGVGFTFQVVLRDGQDLVNPNSLSSGVLTFHGTIDGNLWKPGGSLSYTITDANQTLDVGQHRFHVSFDPHHLINGTDAHRETSVDGSVTVENVPPPSSVPEPSTAVLCCLGLAGMGAFGARRWKKAARCGVGVRAPPAPPASRSPAGWSRGMATVSEQQTRRTLRALPRPAGGGR